MREGCRKIFIEPNESNLPNRQTQQMNLYYSKVPASVGVGIQQVY